MLQHRTVHNSCARNAWLKWKKNLATTRCSLLCLEMAHVLTKPNRTPITMWHPKEHSASATKARSKAIIHVSPDVLGKQNIDRSTSTIEVKRHLVPTRGASKTHTEVNCQTKIKLRAICSGTSESMFLKGMTLSLGTHSPTGGPAVGTQKRT